jgi:16S rRNA (adenine1518-N6/adenine1519-N6)-dimethyltransferase
MATDGERPATRTRRLLAELGLRPRRERGQNFLVDPTVAERTAELVCGGERARVLEIGAGLGSLTAPLADRAEAVIALELQPEFVGALRSLLADRPHVTVVEGDALKVDPSDLAAGRPDRWCVAGNLPYYAASAILLRLLEVQPPFRQIFVMVQREVGERLAAQPGDEQYGSLSVVAAYYAQSIATAIRVPRGAFYPQPKVESVVLALEPRREPPAGVRDEALLFEVIRAGFGQRRKQLTNTLARAERLGPIDRALADAALLAAGIAPKARAENVGLEGFIALSNALSESGVRVLACR